MNLCRLFEFHFDEGDAGRVGWFVLTDTVLTYRVKAAITASAARCDSAP
jgi:hypothetical protein